MATQLISTPVTPDYADDSRWERIDGQWRERPVPTLQHAKLQKRMVALLDETLQGRAAVVLPELSLDQPDNADPDDPNYMTADVMVAFPPIAETQSGHLAPPAFLAIEILSPKQTGLFTKTRRYHSWDVEHVWIIDPQTGECFEYHGGDQFRFATDTLHAGPIAISVTDILEASEPRTK